MQALMWGHWEGFNKVAWDAKLLPTSCWSMPTVAAIEHTAQLSVSTGSCNSPTHLLIPTTHDIPGGVLPAVCNEQLYCPYKAIGLPYV